MSTQSKERDINGIVRYLTATFATASNKLPRAARTTDGPNDTYKFQTEFAYRLHEVMVGPKGALQRNIALCNEFIDFVIQYQNKK